MYVFIVNKPILSWGKPLMDRFLLLDSTVLSCTVVALRADRFEL